MPRYFLTWEIDTDGGTPVEAAGHAFRHMRRIDSHACVFSVFDEQGEETRVDFLELDEDGVIDLTDADPARAAFRALQAKLEDVTDAETAQQIVDDVLCRTRTS
ncbi:hypothetical protein HC341_07230 [Aquisalimonas sp. 2447]|uniref:hypothetical protein n=1 Tax=Aquisalimonas sp. 2447 TaxID=2740807 RepID=UPI0014323D10|nr:hypothetical protein [Aquisalimonas sp. 2447]QIT55026.1 hypothetical protein HC341_07230 [Aquisalimonas sp. 2447]